MDAPQQAGCAGARRLCARHHAALHAVRRDAPDVIAGVTIGVLAATSFALLCFGLNLLYLTWSSTRIRRLIRSDVAPGQELMVCVQVPIYNERYVAERVIDAVCAMEWPRARFEVQLLDDSDDETSFIVSRRAAHWRRKGTRAIHVPRGPREGIKASAPAHGP